jgi:hypothetical protein
LQGVAKIIHYHQDSVAKALMDLFPDVGFDKSKFPMQSKYFIRFSDLCQLVSSFQLLGMTVTTGESSSKIMLVPMDLIPWSR